MIVYRELPPLEGLFAHGPRALALDAEGRLWSTGDQEVRAFAPDGTPLEGWATEKPGLSLALGTEGAVWVGEAGQIEIFGPRGERRDKWSDEGHLGRVTSIALAADLVLAGDAASRQVHRFSPSGEYLGSIGQDHRKGGFHIPNGVLDLAVDGEATVWVANPGMHRVEHFRSNGERLGHFGRFDYHDPAGFPGCCNPTSVAVTAEGRVVVAEKALPRVKLYEPDGQLLAVVADEGFHAMSKNLALAVDREGRIYAADPARRRVRIFEPEGT